MQRQQGLGCILLKPGAIEGQVANLLALGIEQEGAHRWRGHIWPGRGPDHGWSDGGYTCGRGWERRKGNKGRQGDGKKSYFTTYQSLQKYQKFFAQRRCAPDVLQKKF